MTGLDEVAEKAALWAKGLYDGRTARIEAGENVPIDWLLPEYRVTWTEITAMFPDLASVDGRLALDRAQERLGLKR